MSTYKLNKEMEAATALKESLCLGDDLDLVRDMVEGETDLNELIGKTILSMDEDSVLLDGLAARLEEFTQRHKRIKARIAHKRACIEQAMVIAERKTLELPTMTATVKRTPPQLQITDEAAIPGEYWKTKDPTLDKRDLLKALKGGAEIPGAQLDNGGIALQLRRN